MGCNESSMASEPKKNGATPGTKPQPAATTRANPVAPLKGGPIKFTHFDDNGRCVPLLMIMAYKNIPFENDVVKMEDWPALKSKTPMGTLPVMKVGTEELVTSLAMLTYLGSIADLCGVDNMEQGKVEAMVNMIEDLRAASLETRGMMILGHCDEAGRQEAEQKLCEGPIPSLSKFLEDNITGSKWLLSKLTTADFWLYGTLKVLSESVVPDIWSRMGRKVRTWKIEFESLPQISSFICKPELRLKYFKGKGRIAPINLMLEYANRKCYRDYILFVNWPTVKPNTPMGTLPVMQVGDEELCTTLSIVHYLGSELGLRGCTHEEDAEVCAMINVIEDVRTALFPIRFAIVTKQLTDESERKAKSDEFYEKHFEPLCKRLENLPGELALFSKLTMADFFLHGTLQVIADSVLPDCYKKLGPKMQEWKKRFEGLPRVKEYLQADGKPTMTLVYFEGVRGRIEPYRMMLAAGGVNFKDEAIPFDKWPALKPKTAMGYLPILKVGDEEIHTSLAILDYIGMEAGFRGADDEIGNRDEIINMIEDVRSVVFPSRFLIRQGKMDEETKQTKITEFLEKTLPDFVSYLEKRATGDKWLLSQMSTADFWLHGTIEVIEDCLVPDIWDKMGSRIKTWKENFETLPAVKQYLETRPKDYTL